MSRFLLSASLVALVACTTPAERCITNATEGLAEIDAEIAEAEANIARGYRLEERAINNVGMEFCSAQNNVKICVAGDHDIPPRQVPIDVAAEQGRLQALKNQRAAADARMQREIAACQSLT